MAIPWPEVKPVQKLPQIFSEEVGTCKSVSYTHLDVYKRQRKWFAWFTNEIPIQDGPYIFQGLPGLIVSISDDNNDYQFKLGEIKSFKWKDLHHASSKKNISWEEFKKIQRNFYDDPIASVSYTHLDVYKRQSL